MSAEFPIALNDRITDLQIATNGQVTLTYDFPVFDEKELAVIRWRAGGMDLLILNTDYQVNDVCAESGGTLTLLVPAQENDIYVVQGATPKARSTDFTQRGNFRAPVVNREFDLIVFMIQELCEKLGRAALVPIGESGITWPPEADRDECRYIVWKDGQPVMSQAAEPAVIEAVAHENLIPQRVITLFDDNGTVKAKRATAAQPSPALAHGFVRRAWAAGETIQFHTQGVMDYVEPIVPGRAYFLAQAAGQLTQDIYTDGAEVQFVGWGVSNHEIAFRPIRAELFLRDGEDGATWHKVSGPPGAGLGADGDFAFDAASGDIHFKAAGTWALIFNTKGADGVDGATWHKVSGTPGVGLGSDDDFAFDQTTGNVYFKEAGAWSLIFNSKADEFATASENLAAFKVIYEQGGGYHLADRVTLAGVHAIVGISLEAAVAGQTFRYRRAGILEDAGFAFTDQKPVFLGVNGELTSTPPVVASDEVWQPIGRALSATRLFIDIGQPILRSAP